MASTVPKAFDEFEAKLRPTEKQQATIASRRSMTAKYLSQSSDQVRVWSCYRPRSSALRTEAR